MSPEITTLRGQLTLTVSDTPAVNHGYIDIQISDATELNDWMRDTYDWLS